MSLLYASSVFYERLRKGEYRPLGPGDVILFDPTLGDTRDPQAAVREFASSLPEMCPAVVGIGSSSYAFYWAIQIAETVKRVHPDCPTVIGGPHEDEFGSEGPGGSIQDYSQLFDFSIQGDGEYLFDRLFQALHTAGFDVDATKQLLLQQAGAYASCPGFGAIDFKGSDGRIQSLKTHSAYRPGLTPRSRGSLDLNILPLPPRHLLSEEHNHLFSVFVNRDGTFKRTAQVMTHRGCPYSCEFCTERGTYLDRDAQNVLSELYQLRNFDYEAVFFDDSTFHLYRQLPDLLRELAASRQELALEFGCLTRADLVLRWKDRYPLDLFERAGFTYFYLGLEHYSDSVLTEMLKGFTTKEIDQCLKLFERTGLNLGVSLLFGFSKESNQTRKETLRLVAEHPNIILVNLSIRAYHPGTTRAQDHELRFDGPPPNLEPEWDLFEEGRWYHPASADLAYARMLHRLVFEVDRETGGRLIPKLKRKDCLLGPHQIESSNTPTPRTSGNRGHPRRISGHARRNRK
jgi:radical SAM superfamily enzyme YgiQ (UPF0313 family)